MALKSSGNNLLPERMSIPIIGSITWCCAALLPPSPKGFKPPQGGITVSWAPPPSLPGPAEQSPALAEVSRCPTSPLPGSRVLMNIIHVQPKFRWLRQGLLPCSSALLFLFNKNKNKKVGPYFVLKLLDYFFAGFPVAILVLPVPAKSFDQTLVG